MFPAPAGMNRWFSPVFNLDYVSPAPAGMNRPSWAVLFIMGSPLSCTQKCIVICYFPTIFLYGSGAVTTTC